MSLTLETLLASPSACVSQLYAGRGSPQQDDAFDLSSTFHDIFGNGEGWLQKIPILTSGNADVLGSGTLVRYRAMVQDIRNPEYYVGAFQDPNGQWRTTKYSDPSPEILSNAEHPRIWERKVYYCVPVPGQSEWYTSRIAAQSSTTLTSGADAARSKRPRDDNDAPADNMDTEQADQSPPAAHNTSAKQQRLSHPSDPATSAAAAPAAAPAGPSDSQGDCMLFVYERDDRLRLHDVVEVVGVISVLPQLALADMDDDEGMLADDDAHPPTSKVLRLHALHVRRQPPPALLAQPAAVSSQLPVLRTAALQQLTAALAGDELAAEYVLLQLLSRVTRRVGDAPLGATCLNIINCPAGSNFAANLAAALQALAPRVLLLPLQLEALNSARWSPSRDNGSTRLSRARLQMAAGTVLVLDETALAAGQLNETGISNLQALDQLVRFQSITCKFDSFAKSFPTSAPVLAISSSRSLLKEAFATALPLQPAAEPAAAAQLEPQQLDLLRDYIMTAQASECHVAEASSPFLSEQFIRLRAADRGFGADGFHSLLSLARLVGVSLGQAQLGHDAWLHACRLEERRRGRLPVVQPGSIISATMGA